jgi:hypothetical protein
VEEECKGSGFLLLQLLVLPGDLLDFAALNPDAVPWESNIVANRNAMNATDFKVIIIAVYTVCWVERVAVITKNLDRQCKLNKRTDCSALCAAS